MTIRVLDPRLDPDQEPLALAPALSSLEGATIGLLDNGKANVTPFLDHLDRILRAEHGVGNVVRRRKTNMSAPVAPELLQELVACDAVVSAVGD